jgi:hypothetical protein
MPSWLFASLRSYRIGTPHYIELATLLALMVGTILVTVGLFRAGWLARDPTVDPGDDRERPVPQQISRDQPNALAHSRFPPPWPKG